MMFKKGLAVTVILLFIGVSVIPTTGTRVSFDDITPPVTTCTLNPPEPNGNNGWYVSDVEVTLNATDDMSGVNVTQFRVDGGYIKTYTEPFNIPTDGEHTVEYRSIDYAGNIEDWKSVDFKIDQTKPYIDLSWETPDNVHVIFTATCSDATSDMDYVEFYMEDVLQFTDNSEPYEWTILWPPPLPPKYFVKGLICDRQFDEQNVTFYALIVRIIEYLPDLSEPLIYATAYDIAGNSETDYPPSISSTTVSVHMFERLTFSNNYTGRIGLFFINAEFKEGPYRIVQSIPASMYSMNYPKTSVNSSEEQIMYMGDSQPDLIIEDIIMRPWSFPNDKIFYCWVKNIGDAKTEEDIEIQTTVNFKLFGILPLFTVFSETTLFGIGGNLYPGESVNLSVATSYDLPKFGIYGFYCTVNPNMKIDEHKYSNNHCSEDFRVIFGHWI